MGKLFIFVSILIATLPVIAQEPAPAAKPANLCIAKIRNQTSTKFDAAKLRQSLVEKLQSTKLAKDKLVTIITIEAEDSDTAADELNKAECQIAVYTRILRKPKQEQPRTLETGTTVQVSKYGREEGEIYGLQCTVERASSGMPLLIDRQFDTRPSIDDQGVLKLLTAESARIEDAIAKKLTPPSQ